MNTRTMNRVAFGAISLTGIGLLLAAPAPRLLGQSGPPAAPPAESSPPPAATAPAAATRPATTQPAAATIPTPMPQPPKPPVVAAPLPSPKAIALAFAVSLDKGDLTVARALVPPGADRARWVEAAVALSAALKRLDAAAVARFGEGARGVSQGQLHLAQSVKAIEQAQEKVEGDAATLTIPGAARPLRLARVDGKWHLLLPEGADVAGQAALCTRLARAADATAADIAAGNYADGNVAARAFAARVTEARLGG